MATPLDSVVVITGASGGIGRATALEFARRGATVVLAARREEALDEAANECREAGASAALVVPTDVTDPRAVEALARRAQERFGRIDVWVNNAAVALFGFFEDVPEDVYARVIQTNFFGYVHGARAVLPLFRTQGRGTLINVISLVARAPQPYTSAYVASKFAVDGWSECLRMELSLRHDDDIHICNVYPAAIDTPLFDNAANYTGRTPKPIHPIYTPERVANAIVSLAEKPRRETFVGAAARFMVSQRRASKVAYEKTAARFVDRDHFRDEPAPRYEGTLFASDGQGSVDGGWLQEKRPRKPLRLVGGAIAAVAVGAAIAAAVRRK